MEENFFHTTNQKQDKTSLHIFRAFSSLHILLCFLRCTLFPECFLHLMVCCVFHRLLNFFLVSCGLYGIVDEHTKSILIFFPSLLTITFLAITIFFVCLYSIRVHPRTFSPVLRCTEPFANHGALPVTGSPLCPGAPSTARGCLKDITSHRVFVAKQS